MPLCRALRRLIWLNFCSVPLELHGWSRVEVNLGSWFEHIGVFRFTVCVLQVCNVKSLSIVELLRRYQYVQPYIEKVTIAMPVAEFKCFVCYIQELRNWGWIPAQISLSAFICFLKNSNAEKKIALTMQDRLTETPTPLYILLLKNWIWGAGLVCPTSCVRQFLW